MVITPFFFFWTDSKAKPGTAVNRSKVRFGGLFCGINRVRKRAEQDYCWLNQLKLFSPAHYLGAGFGMQLLKDVMNVGLDRTQADDQSVRNLAIGKAGYYQSQDFHFARA